MGVENYWFDLAPLTSNGSSEEKEFMVVTRFTIDRVTFIINVVDRVKQKCSQRKKITLLRVLAEG